MPYIFAIIFFLFSISLDAQTQESAAQCGNPVISRNWPDPTIWTDGDYFYTVCTGVKTILRSTDLVNWENMQKSPLSAEAKAQASKIGPNFWAPDMVRIGKKWMLYLTCYRSAENSGIAVFESDSPVGPWEFVSKLTHSLDNGIKDTIDPEVVRDPLTGRVWLFFGSIGKVHRVELSRDGRSLAPNAEYVHVAGLDIDDNPSRSKVFEGAYLYRHKGFWYLFASAGRYFDESYNIVVGRSRSLKGTFVDKEGRRMSDGYGTSVIKSEVGDDFFGPGHNGEIFKDSNGDHYILYHSHQHSTGKPSSRYTLLQRLYWGNDGWPYVETGKPLHNIECPLF